MTTLLSNAAEPQGVVKSIEFRGLTYMSPELARDITSIKIGDSMDPKKVDDTILAFYGQGYFNDVYATFKDSSLVFHFKERPAIASVEVKGYGTQGEKDTLYSQLGLKKGDTFSESKLTKAVDSLKQMLSYKGYYGTVVEPELDYINSRSVSITLNVNRGDTVKIYRSHYFGASSLKRRKIESLSANRQRDPFGFLWGLNDGKLIINELELDGLRIQDVYRRNGFLDASVSKPLLRVDLDSKRAELFYHVDEGVQYRVASVSFLVPDPDKGRISESDLKRGLHSSIGSIVDVQDMRSDMDLLKHKMADIGYAFASVYPDVKQDRENREAHLVYHLNYGKEVFINDVIISGNSKTWDRIIRREVFIAPRDKYSLSSVKSSENALNRMGYFEKVVIEEKRISDDSMDLLVKVSEGRTGELTFGLGYGSYYGMTLNASVNERNLFGSGFSSSLYANLSFGGLSNSFRQGTGAETLMTQQSINFSLTNHRVLDSSWSLSMNIYYDHSLSYDYTQEVIGGALSTGRLLSPTTRIDLTYDINRTNTFDFVDMLGNPESKYAQYYSSTSDAVGTDGERGKWDRNYQGNNAPYKSSLTPSVSFDNTDSYYFPRRGISSKLSTQFAGIFGDVKYTKIYAKTAMYYDLSRILKFDVIGRYKIQGGYIFRYNRSHFLPLNDTFSMGGMGTVRGYISHSISPIDSNGLRVGGDGMFTTSFDLSHAFIPSANMRLVVYVDIGSLSYHGRGNRADFLGYGTVAPPVSYLNRGAMGVSLEWVSPIGPIVLIAPFAWYGPDSKGRTSIFSYSEASRIRESFRILGDYPTYFEFTMGTRF